jgi:hypothetical protein
LKPAWKAARSRVPSPQIDGIALAPGGRLKDVMTGLLTEAHLLDAVLDKVLSKG